MKNKTLIDAKVKKPTERSVDFNANASFTTSKDISGRSAKVKEDKAVIKKTSISSKLKNETIPEYNEGEDRRVYGKASSLEISKEGAIARHIDEENSSFNDNKNEEDSETLGR